MKKYFAFLLIFIIAVGRTTVSGSDKNQELFDSVKAVIKKNITEYGIPGIQVCISGPMFDNDIKISEGVLDINSKQKLENETGIKVGSITKSFTGIGILKLINNGLINLDDSVSKYIVTDDKHLNTIKIKELLNMHSGLRGYINDDNDSTTYIIDTMIDEPEHLFTPEELVVYGIRLTDNMDKIGKDEFHYTNTNYILLGMIIEAVSGMKYQEFIQSEIIEPYDLRSTYYPDPNGTLNNVSKGYYLNMEDGTTTDFSELNLSYVWSAGALISNAADICKWISIIGNGKIQLGENSKYIYEGFPAGRSNFYTSGLINETDRLWHNGTVLGYHGEMSFLKESRTAITVLSNCSISGLDTDPVSEIMKNIISLIIK